MDAAGPCNVDVVAGALAELSGRLIIRMDEGDVVLGRGDSYVVPRGRPHQPCADEETTILLFEPSETVNTGDTPST